MHPKLQQLAASINAAHLANEQGDFKQAEQLCKKALKIDKTIPEAWYNLGIAFRGLDHKKEAILAQREAMKLARNSAGAQNSIGLELLELGEHKDAETALRRALRIDPNHAFAYSNLSKLFTAQKKHTEALTASERAHQLSPDHPKILVNLGASFNAVKEYQKAESLLKKAISLDDKSAEAFNNLGSTLSGLNRFEEAESQLRKAIALAPNFEHAWTNLGGVLNELNRPREAETVLRHAIKLAPHSVEAFSNLGATLNSLGHNKEAEEILRRALVINEQDPEANNNLGQLLLGLARFPEGWPHYEYRFSTKKATLIKPLKNAPRWDGVLHDELRLLVIAEQGIGDEVLYAHFLQQLNETDTAKPITVTADGRLIPIYERSFSKLRFLDRKQPTEEDQFNTQIPLASLGQFFLKDKNDFSKTRHPYLQFDPEDPTLSLKKLQTKEKRVCGLSWSSKNKAIGQPKSLDLDQLAPILTLPNLQFVNLQYGDVHEQIGEIERQLGIEIFQIDEIDNTNDIDGLLSIISACDLVVTTSNVTTHLAGAINKETYQLSPKGNGKLWYWRNQDAQGHSFWYPSVKILEQEEIGDWSAPIAKLKTILENR
jgi:tetratricopeptide (TPR) repeat protein